ncbi:MAG: signal peptidase II [Patescibacteria group bacterium]
MRRFFWLWAGIILVLFVADRITRTLAFARPAHELIPGVLQSAPATNRGIALGIALPGPLALLLVAMLLIVVAVIARQAYRNHNQVQWVAALLVGSGAVSNLLDRLTYGYVRDFLKLSFLPTTANLGDWMIVLGTFLLILASMPRRHTRSTPP